MQPADLGLAPFGAKDIRPAPVRPTGLMTLLTMPLAGFAATRWNADKATSTLGFTGSAEGENFSGTFKQFTPKITFDPADLANSSFDVSIALASADSANAERDETLQGSEFFDTAKTPQASYVATAFRDLGNGKFAADGTLTLRGITKPVVLEFSWASDGATATLQGQAIVNRLEFNIGGGDWAEASTIVHEIGVSTTLKLSAQ